MLFLFVFLVWGCLYSSFAGLAGASPPPGQFLYGGIIGHFINSSHVNTSQPDVVRAIEIALKHLEDTFMVCPSPAGTYRARVTALSKSVLQSTDDDQTGKIHQYYAGGRIYARPVILGMNYYFNLEWDVPISKSLIWYSNTFGHVVVHRFVITRDRTDKYVVLSHVLLTRPHSVLPRRKNKGHFLSSKSAWQWMPLESEGKNPTQKPSPKMQKFIDQENPIAGRIIISDHISFYYGSGKNECPSTLSLYPGYLHDSMWTRAIPSTHLRVLSYNIWNINGHDYGDYFPRMDRLGKRIVDLDPDIIALQEVRHDAKRDSQPSTLSRYLPSYSFVYQPAMTYPEDIFTRVEEGTAVFSRFPILSSSFILLSKNRSDSTDNHQRACLRVEVDVPTLGPLNIFVTHLALSETARDRTVVEIWDFMKQYDYGPVLLMGDLNANPDTRAMRFLDGKEEINGVRTDGLFDTFLSLYPEPRPGPMYDPPESPRDYGLTFNALDPYLNKRIDYAFLRRRVTSSGDDLSLHDVRIIPESSEESPASDHLPLFLTFNVKGTTKRRTSSTKSSQTT